MLNNISEDYWEEIFRNYRGSLPNRSNSDYDNGLVSGYICFEHVNGYTMKHIRSIQDKITKLGHNVIASVNVDTDEINKIAHFDIELVEDITEKELRELLKSINLME